MPAIVSPVRDGAAPVMPASCVRYFTVLGGLGTFDEVGEALVWPTDC